ncbi:MAG: hypothetical protein Q7S51_01670 [Gallionellaceae bacterium]|nr:hypothetical protein [Gallionellaceae bacterium]
MCKRFNFSIILTFVTLCCLPLTALAYEGEFLLFPTLAGLHRNAPIIDHPQDEIEPSLDAFYSVTHERFRFLAEYIAAPDHKMMERLQIGWLPSASSTLWLGRFHNPLGYWNTEFHHGNYLTTTISRPGIVAFEEHGGGVLPMHLSGLLWEGTTASPFSYSAAMGIGPKMEMMGLAPVEILQPTKEHGRLSATARLVYKAQEDKMNEFGIFTAYTRIPTEDVFMDMGMGPMLTGITQTLVGAEINHEFGNLRLIGEWYLVHNRLEASSTSDSHTFSSAYLQTDYSLRANWILFGRVEHTARAKDDPYLDLRPEFVRSRSLAGIRYALTRNQALKLELSHSEQQDQTKFRQVAIEWSAVFP